MAIDRNKTSQSAEKLVAQGKIEAAIEILEKLVKDNPRDMNTINKIGDLYSRLGRKQPAIEQFSKIGEFYTREGFVLKAIAIYKKIHKLDPSYLACYERLADLYVKQGLLPEARAQYRAASERYLKANDTAGALKVVRELSKLEPEDAGTRGKLADLLAQSGETQEAVDVLVRLGEDLEKKGMKKEAGAFYAKADELQPAAPALVARMARSQAASGDKEGAIERLQAALEAGRADADLLALLAEIQLEVGSRQQALESLERAFAANPDRNDLLGRLCRMHVAEGDAAVAHETLAPHVGRLIKEEQANLAAALLEEILNLDVGNRGVLKQLEEVHRARGDEKQAVECMERLLDLAMDTEDYDDAVHLAEILTERRPEDESVKLKLELVMQARSRGGEGPPAAGESGENQEAESLELIEPVVEDEPLHDPPAEESTEVVSPPGSIDLPVPVELSPEDEDFITEHMTEADVFVKYGLSDKAVDQLMTVTQRFPSYIPAHLKLKEIYLEEGNRIAARAEMATLVKAHLAAEDMAAATEIFDELSRFDPACSEVEDLGRILGRGEPAAASPGPEQEPAETAEPAEEAGGPSERDFALIDQHLAAGEKDEAVELLRALAEEFGSHPGVVSRMKTALALKGLQAEAARQGGGPAETLEGEPEEFEIELEEEEEPPSPAPVEAAAEMTESSDGLSDLSDLAAEIEEALSGAAEPDESIIAGKEASPEGHSLEEIVQAFKKGVEQQLGDNDHETHYNLGIAYKEMGLVDEAIGEFQAASKESGFLLDSCLMLGVCFREKGMPALAEKWYRRGLEAGAGEDEEKVLGLRYDLADLLQDMNQTEKALGMFTEVFGVNSKFRDVADRIREIEKGLA